MHEISYTDPKVYPVLKEFIRKDDFGIVWYLSKEFTTIFERPNKEIVIQYLGKNHNVGDVTVNVIVKDPLKKYRNLELICVFLYLFLAIININVVTKCIWLFNTWLMYRSYMSSIKKAVYNVTGEIIETK